MNRNKITHVLAQNCPKVVFGTILKVAYAHNIILYNCTHAFLLYHVNILTRMQRLAHTCIYKRVQTHKRLPTSLYSWPTSLSPLVSIRVASVPQKKHDEGVDGIRLNHRATCCIEVSRQIRKRTSKQTMPSHRIVPKWSSGQF